MFSFEGLSILGSIKTGRIKSTKYGNLPKVLLSSGLGYFLGKTSYLLGEACDDKFLKLAPNSDMAKRIKYNRSKMERKLYTDEEIEVMRQCVKEAFWYRSLPASLITGGVRS